eukprot:3077-Hanusia_phi.AAC.2
MAGGPPLTAGNSSARPQANVEFQSMPLEGFADGGDGRGLRKAPSEQLEGALALKRMKLSGEQGAVEAMVDNDNPKIQTLQEYTLLQNQYIDFVKAMKDCADEDDREFMATQKKKIKQMLQSLQSKVEGLYENEH